MHTAYLIILLLSISSFFLCNASDKTEIDLDPKNHYVEYWVPKNIKDNNGQLEILIKQITKEESFIAIENNETNKDLYFGFSFPRVNFAQALCLREVRDRYEKCKVRPKVADLGAGHGLMTWKQIVAGGNVFAIEHQDPTKEKMRTNVKKAIPFLSKGEKLSSISRCNNTSARGNVLSFDTCVAYDHKFSGYDITWSGNLIHLFTPNEATDYVKNLYKITKPGGYAFATVQAPCQNKSILSHYLKRKKSGLSGCFMTNSINYWRQYVVKNLQKPSYLLDSYSQFVQMDLSPVDKDIIPESPTIMKHGFYEGGEIERYDEDDNDGYYYDDDKTGNRFYTYKCNSHSFKHFFDAESLKNLFESGGFIVENVFYMDGKSNTVFKAETSLDEIIFEDKEVSIWVGIKARREE